MIRAFLAFLLALTMAPAARAETPAEGGSFLTDLQRLTRAPHRLSGSEEGRAAAAYIEQRLRGEGIREVLPVDMPVFQARTVRCDLTVGGVTIPLSPLRPNITILPVTPPEGLSGKLLYAGKGTMEDYRDRSPAGAIVVLDYTSVDGWSRAFALGARAVVFLGHGDDTALQPKHAGVPANQPRFYASDEVLDTLDLRVDRPLATLVSQEVWEPRIGRNVVARIAGTAPRFDGDRSDPETMVLSAHYDSFGEVPERSAGARGAGNVAALLQAAALFQKNPPRRDVLFLFLDNQARYHQGAREVYDALEMSSDLHAALSAEHRAEIAQLGAVRELLGSRGLRAREASPAGIALKRAFSQTANDSRDDARQGVELVRLRTSSGAQPNPGDLERVASLEIEALDWDEVRRALHRGTLADFVEQETRAAGGTGSAAEDAKRYLALFARLQRDTLDRLDRRLAELGRIANADAEREALRKAASAARGGSGAPPSIVLHVSFDFSDSGPTWGVVAGDWTPRFFAWRAPKSEGDSPGYYGRILNAIGDVEKTLTGLDGFDATTLADPTQGTTFAPGTFVSSGAIAGAYGIYNVALMTGHDARVRDGHPADTLEALDWRRLHEQAAQGTKLVRALADSPEIALPAVFKSLAISKYPRFEQGQSSGDYAALQVSGGLKEDRPAAGAIMALWPGNVGWTDHAWSSMQDALLPAYFDPIAIEPVEQTGRFRVIGLREDLFTEVNRLATLFDDRGEVRAITTQEKLTQKIVESMRVNLFFGNGYFFTGPRGPELSQPLSVLNGASDAPFRDNRALFGELRGVGFCYLSQQIVEPRIKLFQPQGAAVLGDFSDLHPSGIGVLPADLGSGVRVVERTAHDLWTLNEERFRQLRSRGVTSADLEILHARARRALEQATISRSVAAEQTALADSASLSQRVYQPLRSAMDDLVHAIVLLLLLAIPFAFAIERLTISATTVYGRIGGFSAAFLATFALLYELHPGFAIASTPAIVFLAFAIVLLSSLVIYIVVRKFKSELKAMQGQSSGVHALEVSQMGTLLAAVAMGMSTMRRRPMRTTLTAVTVVMLTFTILAFASFSRTVGVRATYQGPKNEHTHADLLVRKLDYSPLDRGLLDVLRGQQGPGGALVPNYWLLRQRSTSDRFSIARKDNGESLTIDAVMGIGSEELARWPELARAFGADGDLSKSLEALAQGEVFLPSVVERVLALHPGDPVLLNGHEVRFAGTMDGAAIERLKELDGQSILPVDFKSTSASDTSTSSSSQVKDETQVLLASDVDREFVHLGADQTAIASPDLVQKLGGKLHSIAIYGSGGGDVRERGRRVTELAAMPVWAAGPDGVERLVFTVLTEVSGGLSLFVPLLLGGLIIFGTLLGSISDREREIYTFSALGLSPGHVGALFFAEAAVYAVVGGMGGQLLAELVAVAAGHLAKAGYIEAGSINYSSTNSLFAMAVVMTTVLVSAIYPALRASRSANPGLARSWKMPPADGDTLRLIFPFTVSTYDITGLISFLAEHFRQHDDAGLGDFAASSVDIARSERGNLSLRADLALAPFDLGVTQHMELTAVPSEIEGVDEVAIRIERRSGTRGDWYRANRIFVRNLRRQFLLWRTLSSDVIEQYRMQTLEVLGPEPGVEAKAS